MFLQLLFLTHTKILSIISTTIIVYTKITIIKKNAYTFFFVLSHLFHKADMRNSLFIYI